MRIGKKLRAPLSLLPAALIVVILLFPYHFFLVSLYLIFLPVNLPFGIHGERDLGQNFREHRPALEEVVAVVRADDFTSAKRGYWGLLGYTRPEPRGVEYQQLYRSMREARIQRVEVVSREPFRVRLVTDENTATIDTNVHGYTFTEDSNQNNLNSYGSYNRLDKNWYLYETEL